MWREGGREGERRAKIRGEIVVREGGRERKEGRQRSEER